MSVTGLRSQWKTLIKPGSQKLVSHWCEGVGSSNQATARLETPIGRLTTNRNRLFRKIGFQGPFQLQSSSLYSSRPAILS
jgi:hypothetical protein